jgi:flavodoxin
MEKKTLVAVFSASGSTGRVGKEIARLIQGDYFEIVPVETYTSDDLNYMDPQSRSSQEMKNADCRPQIANKVVDMDAYDTVIIGYPIWWGVAPRIIKTFLESYDFSGKIIFPFCTSGGSGFGRSDIELHKCVSKDVKWGKGMQIHRPNASSIKQWIEG